MIISVSTTPVQSFTLKQFFSNKVYTKINSINLCYTSLFLSHFDVSFDQTIVDLMHGNM